MTHRDLWALLSGEYGYHAVTYRGRAYWTPVGEDRTFRRRLDAWAYDGDLTIGAVPFLEANYRKPGGSQVLWVVAESPAARDALSGFAPAPTLVLALGATRTALWGLTGGLNRLWTIRLNKRLAHRIGCPKKHAEPWFSFAPPGAVVREGRSRPVAVAVESWTGELYGAREVAGRLPDAPDPDAWKKAA